MTNSEVVSRVINDLKGNTKDGHISRRFVLSILKTKARFLMSQKLDEMTLFKEYGIISNISCLKMKEINTKECDIFEFRLCNSVMKSCNKIPDILYGKNGPGIVTVTNVDGSKEYHYIQPHRYAARKKRKYTLGNNSFYYIKDGYLYLPDSKNELVEMSLYALNKWEVDKVCDCSESDDCKSYWDYEFVCPDRFLDLVVKDTLNELASIFRSSVSDENPDMDENIKSKTTL